MKIESATVLASILDGQDSGTIPPDYTDQEALYAKRKAVICTEADMRLYLDVYLREKFKDASNASRWRMFMAIGELEDRINEHYHLSEAQVNLFRDDLEDLIDAGIPYLVNITAGETRNTMRIILRVMYQDDYKKFADDMIDKFHL